MLLSSGAVLVKSIVVELQSVEDEVIVMNRLIRTVVVFVMLAGIESFAQQDIGGKLIRVRQEPRFQGVQTPEYNVKRNLPNSSNIYREEWGQISLVYRTSLDWTDELTITYYVLLQPSGDDAPKYKVLTKSITYVNVPKGDHQSVVYMHPTTLKRYGKPEKMAAVFSMNYVSRTGAIVPVQVLSDDSEWWTRAPVPVESGLLLNRKDTPFAVLNDNAYEAQKIFGDNK
jgi:hypothetical protein